MTKILSFLIFCMILTGCACTKPPHAGPRNLSCEAPAFTIHADTYFTKYQQIQILYAAITWNAVTGGAIVVKFDLDFSDTSLKYPYLLLAMTSDSHVVQMIDEGNGSRTLGFTMNHKNDHVAALILDRLRPDMVYPVAAHEIGHLMGLAVDTPHPEDPYALMHGSYSGLNGHITETDLRIYREELCHEF